ncbi:hypothetical protein [Nocardia sp. BMG111209]|uniref:hypothetical protein n=1 Tax=Nocardia sp. BMG111209 TaxID=1160137 RepID=UPI000363BBFB|nr:hypothetical protein [Nocardia sp. BMG111209]
MIQESDIQIGYSYETAELRVDLTASDVAAGFTDHHDYQCLSMLGWPEAADCLATEEGILHQAALSSEADGVEAILKDLAEEDDVQYSELMAAVGYLDIGVAGLSFALSASGAATFYSCSGGSGHHHADYPIVGVIPDAARATAIARLAKSAGCGIDQIHGRWYIFGRSVYEMHNLGQLIYESRKLFDSFRRPEWFVGLADAIADIDSF